MFSANIFGVSFIWTIQLVLVRRAKVLIMESKINVLRNSPFCKLFVLLGCPEQQSQNRGGDPSVVEMKHRPPHIRPEKNSSCFEICDVHILA
jgi:hypothetical protein